MGLINTSVPNLIQGVSQQPDATRFAGQCEAQENAVSSVADGLKKRPNTRHIANLIETSIGEDSFIHFINRSADEKYVVIAYKEYGSDDVHTGCKIRAFNLIDGEEATINNVTGGYALTDSQFSYLHTGNPRRDLKAVSIGDTTLLLNKTASVAPKVDTTTPIDKKAILFITQGGYAQSYTVEVKFHIDENYIDTSDSPTMELELERYVEYKEESRYVRSSSGQGQERRGGYTWGRTNYRWRIANVNLISGGTGVTEAPKITISSNKSVYRQPDIKFEIDSSGTITDAYLNGAASIAGGDFEGVNMSGQYGSVITGSLEPTLTTNISGVTVTTVSTDLSATGGPTGATAAASATSGKAAELLKTAMDGQGFNNKFTVTRRTNHMTLELLDAYEALDFSITTKDTLSDTGMNAIYKTVDSITSLPASNINGFKVKIMGDAEISTDDYYVEFETAQGQTYGGGSYVETVGDNIIKGFEASTMPHQLINDGVNSFTLEEAEYADRIAGDDDSNPLPSFVGSQIDGMFFFKNRLGFLSKENVILSENGFGYINEQGRTVFNFGRNTVTSILDSDPIDVSVASTRVTNLTSATSFQENLVLFSQNGQFVLKSGDLLTPKTVSIIPVTNFDYESSVDPLPLGSYIYFPFTRGQFTGIREFTLNATTDTYDSLEVTEHIPAYIPKNIFDMSGTTSEDLIAILSGDEPSSLYMYTYFWNNRQKVLSSWSKFTFTGNIRGMEFIESDLYIILDHNNQTQILTLPLEAGLVDDAGYNTHLDMRVLTTVLADSSTITLPYSPLGSIVEVYTTDGLKLKCTNAGSTVTLAQAVTVDTDVWVGVPYTMKYTFSQQLFKAKAGQGTSPSNAAKLQIRNGSVYFDNTAHFKVKVTPKFRDTYENVFTPNIVGATKIGSLTLDSGFYRFPIFTKAQDTIITIENDSALPSQFQSAEFESFIHSRSNRYG